MQRPRISLLFAFILVAFSVLVIEVGSQSGTTPDFKNEFFRRCSAFKGDRQPGRNCSDLWSLFSKAFVNKTTCGIDGSDYSDFLNAAISTPTIADKALFWTKVYPFVYNFTGSSSQSGKYVTIVDLLPGYVMDNLKWCWSPDANDFKYTFCPSSRDCPGGKTSSNSFWNASSAHFASLASGVVFAMINGSVSSGAFTDNSQFFTVEVPAMEYPRIKEMRVILVHNPLISFRESCSNFTLKTLNETLTAKGISYTCEEDPSEIKQLQCQLYPEYQTTGYCTTSGQWSLHHCKPSTLIKAVIAITVSLKTAFF